MKIVVIGGVAAGASTATKLKRINFNDEVVMIERGDYVSFANCGLPYYISGDIDKKEKLIVQKPEYFEKTYGINVMINTNVEKIDRKNKTIKIKERNGGREINYDKLVIATGGSPIIPNFEGVDKNHVFKLWTIPDMDKIDNYLKLKNPKKAVVVGGGFVGLEMVEALHERGLDVSLVEKANHLMPNIDGEYARMVKEVLENRGITIYENIGLKSIQDNTVTLENGEKLESDIILLSIGVKPNNELAKDCGLEIGKTGGILVDEYMRTNDSDIFACGDVVELKTLFDGKKIRVPLAGPASKQARIVARNINGENIKYKGSTGASVIKIFDYTLSFVGMSKESSKDLNSNIVTVHRAIHPSYYPEAHNLSISLIYDNDGNILGAEAFGKKDVEKRIDVISQCINTRTKVQDLVSIDLSYSPPYNSPNDPVNYLGMIAENYLNKKCKHIHFQDIIDIDNIFLLDVRGVAERKRVGFIKNSINIPLEDLENRIGELPKENNIYLHCATGMRSYLAVRKLISKGFKYENLYNITGGFTSIKYTQSY